MTEPETVCPACVLGNPDPVQVRLCAAHAAMVGPRLDPSNHHSALTCPYCNPHGLRLQEPEKQRDGDQPLPEAVGGPAMQDLLIADMEARKAVGLKRYGQLLKAHDGRDNLRDIYEEMLDAAVYLRKAIYERDGR